MSFMLLFLILLCITIMYWVLNFSSSAVFLFFVFLFFALRQFRCSSHITYRRTFCASCVTYPLQFCAYGITCLLQFCSLHITLRVLFALPVLLACVSSALYTLLSAYFLRFPCYLPASVLSLLRFFACTF